MYPMESYSRLRGMMDDINHIEQRIRDLEEAVLVAARDCNDPNLSSYLQKIYNKDTARGET